MINKKFIYLRVIIFNSYFLINNFLICYKMCKEYCIY